MCVYGEREKEEEREREREEERERERPGSLCDDATEDDNKFDACASGPNSSTINDFIFSV